MAAGAASVPLIFWRFSPNESSKVHLRSSRLDVRRAHRRWEYALSVIVWQLNGREVHHRRGRRFVVAMAG